MNSSSPNSPSGDPQDRGGRDGRLARFEALLRQDVDSSRVDWESMENSLRERIRAADAEGALSALKADEIPPGGFHESLEGGLFNRIRNHREYQEPIDEVIGGPEGLSQAHWQRLDSKLEDRIRSAAQLTPWEQALKAEEVPSQGHWEGMESRLQKRIDAAKASEAWELALRADEPVATGAHESMEIGLFTRLEAAHRKPAWELALKAEKTLSPGRWEGVEDLLQARIERQQKLAALSAQPFWLGLGLYLSRPAVKAVLGLVFAVALISGSWRVYETRYEGLATLIYQAQGASAGELDSALSAGRLAVNPGPGSLHALQAKEDGALVMVNARGYVDLRNGSRLELKEANLRKVHYRVGFGKGKSASGNATFFVNKARHGETFHVSTPDYRIEVLGTYFRVDPDLDGRVSTAVLEGKVRIRGQDGEFTVEAGQSLAYNPATGKYRVIGGGRTVPREEIETLPGVEELMDFGVLSVTSSVPQAEVRIDGRYRGITPLVVMLPPGPHSLHISRDGHAAYDTLISVEEGATRRLAALLPELEMPVEPVAAPAPKEARKAKAAQAAPGPRTVAAAPEVAPAAEGVAQLFHRADEAQAADWMAAVLLYGKVLEHPQATPMRKQAAQFSIARLRADHEEDKGRAKEDFLRYLALHPDGAFAGESWLRLAELEVGRDPDKAVEYYLKSIAKFPRHHRLAELQHRVGLLHLQNGRYDEAVSMFKQSLGNVLYNSEAERRRIYNSLYRAYLAKGDRRSAELIDERYLPSDVPAPR